MSKFMRVMVFFDLPVKRKVDRKAYTDFRKFLLKDGYDMLQFSVYSRLCASPENAETHHKRLSANLPSKGSVRALIVTENQYAKMKFLVGDPKPKEKMMLEDGVLLIQESFF